jgi:hypothetical protein
MMWFGIIKACNFEIFIFSSTRYKGYADQQHNCLKGRLEDRRRIWWNSERGGDTPELRDKKIRRLEKNIVEQREKRRNSRAKTQENQKTGGEYCGTAREEEILQS